MWNNEKKQFKHYCNKIHWLANINLRFVKYPRVRFKRPAETNYGHFARCSVRPESFRPDRESFRLQHEVVSPGLRVHTYTYVKLWAPFLNEEYSHNFFACLFVSDSSLDRSEKNLELDLFLFILRSSRKRLGRKDFILRAKRLRENRTSGETIGFRWNISFLFKIYFIC